MPAVNVRRIVMSEPGAAAELAALRARLSAQGDVVSPRSRELTQQVFGTPLTPAQVVDRICTDVRNRGLPAVLHYTERLDHKRLDAQQFRVGADDLRAAHASIEPRFLEVIRRARTRITEFQRRLLHDDVVLSKPESHEIRVRQRPIRRVGVCVPGGAAAYPSTVLMTVCPAQAAGVAEIAVVMPPTPHGAYNPHLLATCHELGVSEVYRVGGAQAVAALAYGVEGMPAVDMIVGPGNLFVTLAKKFVFGQVAIDMLAGPSEVVVIADESASAEYVAADLIAQAEHAPGASILITWSASLVDSVAAALERQLGGLPRGELARESLEAHGALVLVRDPQEAVSCANGIAPEHLHIQTRDPQVMAEMIENAGAIFLGPHSPVALGDYLAGPSHVLPTGGTARFASGLSARTFLRQASIVTFTPDGIAAVADDVRYLAEIEGLSGHAQSVNVRQSAEPEA